MTQYLISFDNGWMNIPDDELPAVTETALAMVSEAKAAGVWAFSAGLTGEERVSVVAVDGSVTDGPYPEGKEFIGGFAVIDVRDRAQALSWAAKIAVVCRCSQEVRELLPAPGA